MRNKPLTEFQKVILEDLLAGESIKDLSKKYKCSLSLIDGQIRNICKKLNSTFWGMRGGRRQQTIKELEITIKKKNDSNRFTLEE